MIFRFIGWCFTSGMKGVIVMVIIVVLFVAGGICVKNKVAPKHPSTTITNVQNVPSKTDAPYMVNTTTRQYLAIKATQDKTTKIWTLDGYYEFLGKRWTLENNTLVLDVSFGKVTVSKR